MINNKISLLYKLLVAIYLIGGCAAVFVSFVYNFNRESVGFALLIGTLLSYVISRHTKISGTEFKLQQRYFKVTSFLFVLMFIFTLFVVAYSLKNYFLPIEFFIIVTIMALIIMIQILFFKLSKYVQYIILLEIFIFSITLSSSFNFIFPGPIGNDAYYHINFIESIIDQGNINSYIGNYVNYPIFHLFYAEFINITGLNEIKITQVFLAIYQIIFFCFLFLLTKKIFNDKIALISVLLFSITPYIVQPQFLFYPMAFTFTIFLLSLYLLNNISRNKVFLILFLISFVLLTFAHPLSPFFLLFIVLLFYGISKVGEYLTKSSSKIQYITGAGLLFMLVLMILWWMQPVGSGDLFSNFIISLEKAFLTVDTVNVEQVTLSQRYNSADVFLYDLGFVSIIFFAVLGSFYGIKKIINNKEFKFDERVIYLIITLIIIPIPYLMAIIYPGSLPDRWFVFISIFLSISASVGIITLFNFVNSNKLKLIPLVLIIFLIFFNITSPIVNQNTHIYSEDMSTRHALTSSEINAVSFITSNYNNISQLKGNSLFISFTGQNLTYRNYLDPTRPEIYTKGVLVVRDYDLKNGFTVPASGAGQIVRVKVPNQDFFNFLASSNEIYNNGPLEMYINSS